MDFVRVLPHVKLFLDCSKQPLKAGVTYTRLPKNASHGKPCFPKITHCAIFAILTTKRSA